MFPISMNEKLTLFKWGAVIGASLIAASGDLKNRRIPNSLTFALFLTGLIWAIISGGLSGLGEAFLACFLLGIPYVLLFVFAGGGAGDAKLMGAIGTWLGLRQSVVVLFCVAFAGILIALIKAISKRQLRFVLTSVFISFYTFIIFVTGGKKLQFANKQPESCELSSASQIPYGVAICAGVCLAAAVVWRTGVEWIW
jgi:prepilin peptidase CpaA